MLFCRPEKQGKWLSILGLLKVTLYNFKPMQSKFHDYYCNGSVFKFSSRKMVSRNQGDCKSDFRCKGGNQFILHTVLEHIQAKLVVVLFCLGLKCLFMFIPNDIN